MIIMPVTFTLKRGTKPTAEQLAEIYANAPKSDDEIDLSDIPEITHEEFERAIAGKHAKLREKNLKNGMKKIPSAIRGDFSFDKFLS